VCIIIGIACDVLLFADATSTVTTDATAERVMTVNIHQAHGLFWQQQNAA
jgi:hypothetical protein